MNLEQYIAAQSNIKYSEKIFLKLVFYPMFGEYGLNYITSGKHIKRSNGKNAYIDFTIKTKFANYAIEVDDYGTHGANIGRPSFEDHELRQNDIVNLGYKLYRFSLDTIKDNAQKCINQLYQAFVGDEELNIQALGKHYGIIKPYPFQEATLKKLEKSRSDGNQKGMIIHATGLGKTYLSAFDAKKYNKKTLFIVHLNDVLLQTHKSYDEVWPESSKGIYNGDEKTKDIINKDVVFASIQTLSRKINLEIFAKNHFDYIIIDESHHARSPTYNKLLEYFNPKFLLGLTATPVRTDGFNVKKLYDDNIIDEITTQEAIDKGYLVPFKYIVLDDDVDYSNIKWNGFKYNQQDLNSLLMIQKRDDAVLRAYLEYCKNRKTIAFCVSIDHAERMATFFNSKGIKSKAIHSDISIIDKDERRLITEGFRNSDFEVAFVRDVFNEGIDFPDVESLLFLRPTESKIIFTQQLGRGLRLSAKKNEVIVLDFVGQNQKNSENIRDWLEVEEPINTEETQLELKLEYHYDNNNCEVHFTKNILDHFARVDAISSPHVREDKISKEWKGYGSFIEEKSKTNQFFKVGQQNKDIYSQLIACDIISKNPSINDDDFKKEIAKFTNEMTAGKRGLFLAKIIGLLKKNGNRWIVSEVFEEIKKIDKTFSNFDSYKDIITLQFEKIFYYNNIYRPTDIQVPQEDRVYFDNFDNYFIIQLYKILFEIGMRTGEHQIYLHEWRLFVIINQTYSDWSGSIENILKFREEKNFHDLRRFLIEKITKITNNDRVKHVLKYIKYIKYDDSKNLISLNNSFLNELEIKLNKFENLFYKGQLIKFSTDQDLYLSYLSSKSCQWA